MSEDKIILASKSPRRMKLLEQTGFKYIQVEPYEEEDSLHPNPRIRVMENAEKKALSIKEVGGWVLSADTLVCIEGEIMGKPENMEDARRMLRKLSGQVHEVHSGVTLLNSDSGEMHTCSEKTLVHMKTLTEEEINKYLQSGEPMGKAGGYAIQGLGGLLIDRVVGCFHNVVGLPLSRVWDLFNEFNIDPFTMIKT